MRNAVADHSISVFGDVLSLMKRWHKALIAADVIELGSHSVDRLGVAFEVDADDNYGRLLLTFQPEGGPRHTVSVNGTSDVLMAGYAEQMKAMCKQCGAPSSAG